MSVVGTGATSLTEVGRELLAREAVLVPSVSEKSSAVGAVASCACAAGDHQRAAECGEASQAWCFMRA